jgi:hypothetical protein
VTPTHGATDVAPAHDRGKRRDKRPSEPPAETREFWETWAETKTTRDTVPSLDTVLPTRDTVPTLEVQPVGAAEADTAVEPRQERGGRGRGRERDRGDKREARDKRETRYEKPARGHKKDQDQDKKPDDRRAKGDTTPQPVAGESGQARLFVSLGKKHGVTADDLRTLLAGPLNGDTSRIGSVSLRDSHAHVRVPEELVDAIIAGVHGTLHNDHNVTVERARA